MAIRDPRVPFTPTIVAPRSERFELRVHEVQPEQIIPNGDRYVVETIDLDEKIEIGSILVVTQQPGDKPGDPMADPTNERRGVIAAVVIRAGNGHLLGLSDHPVVIDKEITSEWAAVPMFFAPGDVVLVDHTARGRALKIVGRECRIINQIDVLAQIDGIKLERVNGAWQEVEAE